MKKYLRSVVGMLMLCVFCLVISATAMQESGSTGLVPTPKELWQRFKKSVDPLQCQVTQGEVVPSESDPGTKLRRISFEFSSQKVPFEETDGGKTIWRHEKLWHKGVIFIPTDPRIVNQPGRLEKVVIVGSLVGGYLQSFISNYGDPIAVRTGYPTMVLPNPGELEGFPGQM